MECPWWRKRKISNDGQHKLVVALKAKGAVEWDGERVCTARFVTSTHSPITDYFIACSIRR